MLTSPQFGFFSEYVKYVNLPQYCCAQGLRFARQMPRIALCVFLAMHPVYTSTSDTAAALQEDYKFLNLVRPFPAVYSPDRRSSGRLRSSRVRWHPRWYGTRSLWSCPALSAPGPRDDSLLANSVAAAAAWPLSA